MGQEMRKMGELQGVVEVFGLESEARNFSKGPGGPEINEIEIDFTKYGAQVGRRQAQPPFQTRHRQLFDARCDEGTREDAMHLT
jgi:hypothetical protein